MLFETLRAARDLGRLHDIAAVLVRHGFGDLARRLGLGRVFGEAHKGPPIQTPERVRQAMEELGPTFVKLGQMLAARRDLLAPEWIDELSSLHQRVQPVPYEELREQLLVDLGAPPEELFAELDTTPLAAGSMAQVHRARLRAGDLVVLKILRPGVRAKVEADLRLLTRLANVAESELPDLARFRPKAIVRELSRSLRDELDLRIEARNTERISKSCAGYRGLAVPRVYWEWTRERVCVQSFLAGTSAAEWSRTGEPADLDRKELASAGADVVLKMVFEDGFFHADPHPGNVLFLPGGEHIGLLDFGMVGRLSEERRRELVDMLTAVVLRDDARLVDLLLEWSGEGESDVETLAQDCHAFIDRYHGLSLKDIDVGRLLTDLSALVRENNLFLPGDVALLMKVFLTLEGFGRQLDPDFDMTGHLEPFIERMVKGYASPMALIQRNLGDLRSLLMALPSDIKQLVAKARRGRFRIELDMRRLERFGRQLDRTVNRLTIGIVTAALIVGAAITMTVTGGPRLLGLPVLGFFGFVISSVLGIGLLWSIWRSPRP